MNPPRKTVSLTAIPAAMALLLTVAPWTSTAARAQSLREAAASVGQDKAGGEDRAEDEDQRDERIGPRGGLGWTGLGLMSAGGMLILGSFTFNDSKGCGFFNELSCGSVGRVYGVTGGTMVVTGLAFLLKDEMRRYPKAPPARPARQTSIAIGPRAIQLRMLF